MEYAIIIPTYNRYDAVITSLKCCLNQTIQPKQIIIVDASPDFILQKENIESQIEIPSHINFIYLKANQASHDPQDTKTGHPSRPFC